jgi:hypothetical protein
LQEVKKRPENTTIAKAKNTFFIGWLFLMIPGVINKYRAKIEFRGIPPHFIRSFFINIPKILHLRPENFGE